MVAIVKIVPFVPTATRRIRVKLQYVSQYVHTHRNFSNYKVQTLGKSPCSSTWKSKHSMFERINWDWLIQDMKIEENVNRRKEKANVKKLRHLWNQLQERQSSDEARYDLEIQLVEEALRFPNDTHMAAVDCGNEPKVYKTSGYPLSVPKPQDLHQLCQSSNYLRTTNLGDLVGTRSYILQGFLAELEQALINFTTDFLRAEGFQFIAVPDFLYSQVIESCGFPVKSERNMIYELETEEGEEPIYLSGTSEMGIAGYLSDRIFNTTDLPLKLASISRCFRSEVSSVEEERGIYRVHNFSKVEMFGVTQNETEQESEELHDYFCHIQEELFSKLELHFRVLEMSPNELGSSAYRKYDIEAWMPGRNQFGEISSCSNCTDYQSRRLNIRYHGIGDNLKFVHTINGTACAIPRMLIAVVESHQDDKGNITLPSILQPYMYSSWNSHPQLKKLAKISFMKNRVQQEKVSLHYDSWRK